MVIHQKPRATARATAKAGYRWFVTFIDLYSRITWIYHYKIRMMLFHALKHLIKRYKLSLVHRSKFLEI